MNNTRTDMRSLLLKGGAAQAEPPTSASPGLTDFSQVDRLDLRYKSVSFGA
jgi:hypothetical protein